MDHAAVYNELIERARGRSRQGYMERHHIVPKCLGGGNQSSNLVYLTAREHFLAHKLLARIHPKVLGVWMALILMGRLASNKSRIFASERQRAAELRRNFKYSECAKKKMSASAKARGRVSPDTEFKPGHKSWNKGIPTEESHRYGQKHSPETIARMRSVQQEGREAQSERMKLWWQERKAAALTDGGSL